ncbi:HupE/UreJ family protein [Colwellia piezophila]|uniref:HupE/UreJ family protein n=1 Tax=Colwellia piezophila TaxID=211668 RepID=UPI00036EFF47|nr:HupE/UreJ family protein [Colwellia piezophila]
MSKSGSKKPTTPHFSGVVSSVFALLLLIFMSNMAYGNQIQLVYLQIEQITTQVDKLANVEVADSVESSASGDGADSQRTYQAMWKQPAKTSNVPLNLQFSDGVKIIKKLPAVLSNGSNIQYFTLTTAQGLAGQSITVVNLEKTNVEVMLKYTNLQGDYSIRITPASPSYTFIKSPSSWQTIQSYTFFGIEHILEGYDHLLFVLCLLLIASTLRKLLWAITGFTLAHSITLVLSTLNIVQLPIVVVEAVIALSIVFLATEIAKNAINKSPQCSLSYRYPVAVSSSFGLLHGFGFASVLLELGLPKNDQLLALGFFNLGVEIGQVLFIAVVLLLMSAIRKMIDIRKHEKINAYMIGSIASMWLIERVMQF